MLYGTLNNQEETIGEKQIMLDGAKWKNNRREENSTDVWVIGELQF